MAKPKPHAHDPRWAASVALADAAQRMPRLGPVEPATVGLPASDARLANAIVHAALQRWLTLEVLLDHASGRHTAGFEPRLRGLLLAAAAQLLLLDRVPGYAAVDRAVDLAGQRIRPGAAKLTNAVLRNLTRLLGQRLDAEPPPCRDVVPLLGGGVALHEDVLPDPRDRRAYLPVAWSVPRRLVERWFQQHGADGAEAMCRAAARDAPILIAVGDDDPTAFGLAAHHRPGFAVYDPDTADAAGLDDLLDHHPHWRVQDPTAAATVASLHRPDIDLDPEGVRHVLDYCAGRGTKTRQLAEMFPQARITATDTHELRRRDLRRVFADSDPVRVVEPDAALDAGPDSRYDVILLDVPCSNTGVLARRVEARYRFAAAELRELTALQRAIVQTAAPSLAPGGCILYSTCSIEAEENHGVIDALASRRGWSILHRDTTLPAGETPATYQDGAFAALVRPTA